MNHWKNKLRYLGLCAVAALGLIAFAAAAANAEGEWSIGGKTLTELGQKEEPILGSGETFTITESSIAKLEITCSTMRAEKAAILKGGESKATFVLESCKLKGLSEETCKVVSPITFTLKDQLFLHNKKTYDLFLPPEGTTFMTVQFEKIGKTGVCLIGENLAFKGTAVAEVNQEEKVKQPFTFSPALEELFPADGLSLGANTATFKGQAVFDLAGAQLGKNWRGVG